MESNEPEPTYITITKIRSCKPYVVKVLAPGSCTPNWQSIHETQPQAMAEIERLQAEEPGRYTPVPHYRMKETVDQRIMALEAPIERLKPMNATAIRALLLLALPSTRLLKGGR